MSSALRRLDKEYTALVNSNIKNVLRDLTRNELNFLTWTGKIVLDEPPYNKGAFEIEITFPVDYPFKPPKVKFNTRIYHPNIDEQGQICLPIINPENWKPATKVEHVIQALVAMLRTPEVEHALRSELAEEYAKDPKKFFKNAEEFTRRYAAKIPNL
ncbi:unnamed protein product [Schistosoma turkestanicum]|nr:unnamed protein product [Schistosoma turkestanicum]